MFPSAARTIAPLLWFSTESSTVSAFVVRTVIVSSPESFATPSVIVTPLRPPTVPIFSGPIFRMLMSPDSVTAASVDTAVSKSFASPATPSPIPSTASNNTESAVTFSLPAPSPGRPSVIAPVERSVTTSSKAVTEPTAMSPVFVISIEPSPVSADVTVNDSAPVWWNVMLPESACRRSTVTELAAMLVRSMPLLVVSADNVSTLTSKL